MHPKLPINKLTIIGLIILLILTTLSCSALPRLGSQTEQKWSISGEDLRSLFDDAVQSMDESGRILLSVDHLEIAKNGGVTISGPCAFANSPEPEGSISIAFETRDSGLLLTIGISNVCGLGPDDPRKSILSDQLTKALQEKIDADLGDILVNRIALSSNRLTMWYVEK